MRRRTTWLGIVLGWLAVVALANCGDADEPRAELDVPLPPRVIPEGGAGDADSGLTCDRSKPFAPPTLVPGLDVGGFLQVPRLSPDERTIYFATLVVTDGAAHFDLARADRPARDASFGPITLLTALNTPAMDNAPMIASDLRSLWFSSTRGGASQIFVSRRASQSDEFLTAELAPGLTIAGPSLDTSPYYLSDRSELWFTSERGDSSADIYFASLVDGSFAPATLASELSGPAAESHVALTEDGLGVLLSSNRDGGAGGKDLWIASRSSTSMRFDAPVPLTELNTAADELGGWLSPDGCRVYFSSTRDTDAQARQRIWYATRTN